MLSAITLLLFDTTELLFARAFLSWKFLIQLSTYWTASSIGSPLMTNLERLTLDKKWNTLSFLILMWSSSSFDSSKWKVWSNFHDIILHKYSEYSLSVSLLSLYELYLLTILNINFFEQFFKLFVICKSGILERNFNWNPLGFILKRMYILIFSINFKHFTGICIRPSIII